MKVNQITAIYGQPTNFQELGDMCFDSLNKTFKKRKNKLISLAFELIYSAKVPNTHHCPINGQTNWNHYNKNTHTSYPGWCGRIWYICLLKPYLNINISSYCHLNTGTGGYGTYEHICKDRFKHKPLDEYYPLSYDIKVFKDDWPGLVLGTALNPDLQLLTPGRVHTYCRIEEPVDE